MDKEFNVSMLFSSLKKVIETNDKNRVDTLKNGLTRILFKNAMSFEDVSGIKDDLEDIFRTAEDFVNSLLFEEIEEIILEAPEEFRNQDTRTGTTGAMIFEPERTAHREADNDRPEVPLLPEEVPCENSGQTFSKRERENNDTKRDKTPDCSRFNSNLIREDKIKLNTDSDSRNPIVNTKVGVVVEPEFATRSRPCATILKAKTNVIQVTGEIARNDLPDSSSSEFNSKCASVCDLNRVLVSENEGMTNQNNKDICELPRYLKGLDKEESEEDDRILNANNFKKTNSVVPPHLPPLVSEEVELMLPDFLLKSSRNEETSRNTLINFPHSNILKLKVNFEEVTISEGNPNQSISSISKKSTDDVLNMNKDETQEVVLHQNNKVTNHFEDEGLSTNFENFEENPRGNSSQNLENIIGENEPNKLELNPSEPKARNLGNETNLVVEVSANNSDTLLTILKDMANKELNSSKINNSINNSSNNNSITNLLTSCEPSKYEEIFEKIKESLTDEKFSKYFSSDPLRNNAEVFLTDLFTKLQEENVEENKINQQDQQFNEESLVQTDNTSKPEENVKNLENSSTSNPESSTSNVKDQSFSLNIYLDNNDCGSREKVQKYDETFEFKQEMSDPKINDKNEGGYENQNEALSFLSIEDQRQNTNKTRTSIINLLSSNIEESHQSGLKIKEAPQITNDNIKKRILFKITEEEPSNDIDENNYSQTSTETILDDSSITHSFCEKTEDLKKKEITNPEFESGKVKSISTYSVPFHCLDIEEDFKNKIGEENDESKIKNFENEEEISELDIGCEENNTTNVRSACSEVNNHTVLSPCCVNIEKAIENPERETYNNTNDKVIKISTLFGVNNETEKETKESEVQNPCIDDCAFMNKITKEDKKKDIEEEIIEEVTIDALNVNSNTGLLEAKNENTKILIVPLNKEDKHSNQNEDLTKELKIENPKVDDCEIKSETSQIKNKKVCDVNEDKLTFVFFNMEEKFESKESEMKNKISPKICEEEIKDQNKNKDESMEESDIDCDPIKKTEISNEETHENIVYDEINDKRPSLRIESKCDIENGKIDDANESIRNRKSVEEIFSPCQQNRVEEKIEGTYKDHDQQIENVNDSIRKSIEGIRKNSCENEEEIVTYDTTNDQKIFSLSQQSKVEEKIEGAYKEDHDEQIENINDSIRKSIEGISKNSCENEEDIITHDTTNDKDELHPCHKNKIKEKIEGTYKEGHDEIIDEELKILFEENCKNKNEEKMNEPKFENPTNNDNNISLCGVIEEQTVKIVDINEEPDQSGNNEKIKETKSINHNNNDESIEKKVLSQKIAMEAYNQAKDEERSRSNIENRYQNVTEMKESRIENECDTRSLIPIAKIDKEVCDEIANERMKPLSNLNLEDKCMYKNEERFEESKVEVDKFENPKSNYRNIRNEAIFETVMEEAPEDIYDEIPYVDPSRNKREERKKETDFNVDSIRIGIKTTLEKFHRENKEQIEELNTKNPNSRNSELSEIIEEEICGDKNDNKIKILSTSLSTNDDKYSLNIEDNCQDENEEEIKESVEDPNRLLSETTRGEIHDNTYQHKIEEITKDPTIDNLNDCMTKTSKITNEKIYDVNNDKGDFSSSKSSKEPKIEDNNIEGKTLTDATEEEMCVKRIRVNKDECQNKNENESKIKGISFECDFNLKSRISTNKTNDCDEIDDKIICFGVEVKSEKVFRGNEDDKEITNNIVEREITDKSKCQNKNIETNKEIKIESSSPYSNIEEYLLKSKEPIIKSSSDYESSIENKDINDEKVKIEMKLNIEGSNTKSDLTELKKCEIKGEKIEILQEILEGNETSNINKDTARFSSLNIRKISENKNQELELEISNETMITTSKEDSCKTFSRCNNDDIPQNEIKEETKVEHYCGNENHIRNLEEGCHYSCDDIHSNKELFSLINIEERHQNRNVEESHIDETPNSINDNNINISKLSMNEGIYKSESEKIIKEFKVENPHVSDYKVKNEMSSGITKEVTFNVNKDAETISSVNIDEISQNQNRELEIKNSNETVITIKGNAYKTCNNEDTSQNGGKEEIKVEIYNYSGDTYSNEELFNPISIEDKNQNKNEGQLKKSFIEQAPNNINDNNIKISNLSMNNGSGCERENPHVSDYNVKNETSFEVTKGETGMVNKDARRFFSFNINELSENQNRELEIKSSNETVITTAQEDAYETCSPCNNDDTSQNENKEEIKIGSYYGNETNNSNVRLFSLSSIEDKNQNKTEEEDVNETCSLCNNEDISQNENKEEIHVENNIRKLKEGCDYSGGDTHSNEQLFSPMIEDKDQNKEEVEIKEAHITDTHNNIDENNIQIPNLSLNNEDRYQNGNKIIIKECEVKNPHVSDCKVKNEILSGITKGETCIVNKETGTFSSLNIDQISQNKNEEVGIKNSNAIIITTTKKCAYKTCNNEDTSQNGSKEKIKVESNYGGDKNNRNQEERCDYSDGDTHSEGLFNHMIEDKNQNKKEGEIKESCIEETHNNISENNIQISNLSLNNEGRYQNENDKITKKCKIENPHVSDYKVKNEILSGITKGETCIVNKETGIFSSLNIDEISQNKNEEVGIKNSNAIIITMTKECAYKTCNNEDTSQKGSKEEIKVESNYGGEKNIRNLEERCDYSDSDTHSEGLFNHMIEDKNQNKKEGEIKESCIAETHNNISENNIQMSNLSLNNEGSYQNEGEKIIKKCKVENPHVSDYKIKNEMSGITKGETCIVNKETVTFSSLNINEISQNRNEELTSIKTTKEDAYKTCSPCNNEDTSQNENKEEIKMGSYYGKETEKSNVELFSFSSIEDQNQDKTEEEIEESYIEETPNNKLNFSLNTEVRITKREVNNIKKGKEGIVSLNIDDKNQNKNELDKILQNQNTEQIKIENVKNFYGNEGNMNLEENSDDREQSENEENIVKPDKNNIKSLNQDNKDVAISDHFQLNSEDSPVKKEEKLYDLPVIGNDNYPKSLKSQSAMLASQNKLDQLLNLPKIGNRRMRRKGVGTSVASFTHTTLSCAERVKVVYESAKVDRVAICGINSSVENEEIFCGNEELACGGEESGETHIEIRGAEKCGISSVCRKLEIENEENFGSHPVLEDTLSNFNFDIARSIEDGADVIFPEEIEENFGEIHSNLDDTISKLNLDMQKSAEIDESLQSESKFERGNGGVGGLQRVANCWEHVGATRSEMVTSVDGRDACACQQESIVVPSPAACAFAVQCSCRPAARTCTTRAGQVCREKVVPKTSDRSEEIGACKKKLEERAAGTSNLTWSFKNGRLVFEDPEETDGPSVLRSKNVNPKNQEGGRLKILEEKLKEAGITDGKQKENNGEEIGNSLESSSSEEEDFLPSDSEEISFCEFNSNDLQQQPILLFYDELGEEEGFECFEEGGEIVIMRGDNVQTNNSERKLHNPDRENLRSLLKKPGRNKEQPKKNRVVFNETKNEFFDADYIILIREECEYDDEEDDGVCTCNQHEMVRLTCCEPNCNCNVYDGYDPTPQSPKFAPPLEFVDAVTLSPPEEYKDMELEEQQLIALQQQMVRRGQRGAVCRECSASHDEEGEGSLSDNEDGVEMQSEDQREAEEKEKTDQSQQTTPTTPPPDNGSGDEGQRYILETLTMTTVSERQIVKEAEDKPQSPTPAPNVPPGGSPISGILKGGRLWKQASNEINTGCGNGGRSQDVQQVQVENVTSDDEGTNKRSVRFIETKENQTLKQRDVCDGAPEVSLREEVALQQKLEPKQDGGKEASSQSNESTEMMLTFKLGNHVLISNNSLKPNSAVRQLFPCTKPLGKTEEDTSNNQQYLVTAESLKAFEEAKRSKLPQIIQSGDTDESIRRAIERNTLRRSLIRGDPKNKKSAQKTDNSLVERIKQLTCDVDDDLNISQEELQQQRASPPGEEARNSPEVSLNRLGNNDKSFSPSSSSTASSNSSSMSSTYKKITDLFSKKDKPDIQNVDAKLHLSAPDLGNGPQEFAQEPALKITTTESRKQFLSTLVPLTACVSGIGLNEDYYHINNSHNGGDRNSMASSVGTEYSLEDIDEVLRKDEEEGKKIAPDVLAGTPSASESGDELAMFVQQDAGRIERIKKKYQPETTEEDDEHDDYGFNRRPSVRGIKPRFGSTTEILQQIQNQMQPPNNTPPRNQVVWPYYSETNLTSIADLKRNPPPINQNHQPTNQNHPPVNQNLPPYPVPYQGNPNQTNDEKRAYIQYTRPTSYIEENLYQNCTNQRCTQINYRNMNVVYPSVVRVGGGCGEYNSTIPRRNSRPLSPPPQEVSKNYHQTMVYIPYNHIEGYHNYYAGVKDCYTRVSNQNQINKRYIEAYRMEDHYSKPVLRQQVYARSESPQFSTARSTQTYVYPNANAPNRFGRSMVPPPNGVLQVWSNNQDGGVYPKINRHSYPRYPPSDSLSLTDSDSQHSKNSMPNSPTKGARFIERGVPEGAASVSPQDSQMQNNSTMTSPTSPQNPQGPKPMFYAMNV